MSRFTRFSWGKIWFVDIGPCKRFDIFQLCVKISQNEEMGDDDATPPGDLLPSGALFIVPGRFSNSEKSWVQFQRLGHLRRACWKARQRVQSRMVRPQKLKNNEIWCCPLSSGELSGFLILNSSFEYIMWVGFSFLWGSCGVCYPRRQYKKSGSDCLYRLRSEPTPRTFG